MRYAHDLMCTVNFFRVYLHPSKNCYSYFLSFNSKGIIKIQLEVNVANGFAIDVANNVLPVWWMEVYPFRVDQSKSLLHAEIKWYNNQLWNDELTSVLTNHQSEILTRVSSKAKKKNVCLRSADRP